MKLGVMLHIVLTTFSYVYSRLVLVAQTAADVKAAKMCMARKKVSSKFIYS